MQDTTWPPTMILAADPDTVQAAEARLCAKLGAMAEWAEAHGDNGAADRDALWQGYRLSHELMMAFCAVDGAAFGGGR